MGHFLRTLKRENGFKTNFLKLECDAPKYEI